MALCLTAIAQKQSSKTLVAYFSATGTTEKAAKVVAEVTGGTLYEIQPAKKYTSADQPWLIYDIKRAYGFYYYLKEVRQVTFEEGSRGGTSGHVQIKFLVDYLLW